METVYDFGNKIGGARKDLAQIGRTAGADNPYRRTRRAARPARFGIYGGYGANAERCYVARYIRGGISRGPVPLRHFASIAEARAWVEATPLPELEKMHRAALAALAITDEVCRRPENKPRSGPDYRHGRPVSPAEFMATFRPYGVEFGNWQDNRQGALDQAYDALRDLATTVGIPTEEIGMGGTLGLAFGARGHGAASAHYESARHAINLTKTRGAGCLAHEWFHAYDHDQSGRGSSYRAFTQTEGLRRLAVTLRGLPMYRRARKADATRSKAYWSEPHEMAARAFEAWVRSRVENDYLANIRTPAEFDRPGDCYPYPLAEEMPTIDAAFRQLFGAA
jgi:hypothetical protein